MPPINPNGRLPRLPPRPPPPPIQFENRTPESFQRNGFVNTTPASAQANPHQAPVNPDFIHLTARDYRPELRIDTTVGGGRPVGQASPSHHGDTTLSAPIGESTLSAFTEESGRRAPMHPGLGGSSSGHPGSGSTNPSWMDSPLDPFRLLTPPPPSTTPSLASPGSSATHPMSPYTPSALSDDGRIYDENSPSRMITRSPSFEIPEPMFFESNLTGPITRPSSPDRSTAPSPDSVRTPASPYTLASEGSGTPFYQAPPTPGAYVAPTPGAFNWDSPGGFYNPAQDAHRSPTPYDSNPPTPGFAPTPGAYGQSPSPGGYGYAPTPGGYTSPTPGAEAAAEALMRLHSSDPSALPSRAPTPGALGSGATTPRAFDAPTPGAPGTP